MSSAYLFARFAWAILFKVKLFVIEGQRRYIIRLSGDVKTGKIDYKTESRTGNELKNLYGGGGSKTATPKKRKSGQGSTVDQENTAELSDEDSDTSMEETDDIWDLHVNWKRRDQESLEETAPGVGPDRNVHLAPDIEADLNEALRRGEAALEESSHIALGDPETKPSDDLRSVFKKWQHAPLQDITESRDIIDFQRDGGRHVGCVRVDKSLEDAPVLNEAYEIPNLPGLLIFPSLLPQADQVALLDKTIHRDLSNPSHQTNLHFHHCLPYDLLSPRTDGGRLSFFDLDGSTALQPKDLTTHKAITVEQMLRRKLRWMTLGGQYDWTRKVYPDETPPAFPPDVVNMLKEYFPSIDPQAAIVNFYTPGDTLSVHRDVSEESDQALVSLSIGCDSLFLIANYDASECATIRLRSGDAVLMSGESRFAWHGVPRVLSDTCPPDLRDWPCGGNGRFSQWRGWLGTKRININVRQMMDSPAMK
ncbi:hypothetical protein DV736_g173, partial [Chaetothyriales sp. CBS 134916]